jgi:hypothetical protein
MTDFSKINHPRITDEVSDILDNAIEQSETAPARKEVVAEWTLKINDAWKSAKDLVYQSVFEIGTMLVEAKEQLSDKEFSTMVGGTILKSRSNALNYMRFASRPFLRHPDVFPYLPLKVGVLIDLAAEAWAEVDIRRAIEQGVIHPHATRSEIAKWREAQMAGKEDETNDGSDEATSGHGSRPLRPEPDKPRNTTDLPPPVKPGFVTVFKIEAHTSQCDRNTLNAIERDLKEGLGESLRLKRVEYAWMEVNVSNDNVKSAEAA